MHQAGQVLRSLCNFVMSLPALSHAQLAPAVETIILTIGLYCMHCLGQALKCSNAQDIWTDLRFQYLLHNTARFCSRSVQTQTDLLVALQSCVAAEAPRKLLAPVSQTAAGKPIGAARLRLRSICRETSSPDLFKRPRRSILGVESTVQAIPCISWLSSCSACRQASRTVALRLIAGSFLKKAPGAGPS